MNRFLLSGSLAMLLAGHVLGLQADNTGTIKGDADMRTGDVKTYSVDETLT